MEQAIKKMPWLLRRVNSTGRDFFRLLPRLFPSAVAYFSTIMISVQVLIYFIYTPLGSERWIEEIFIGGSITTIVGIPIVLFGVFQMARVDELATKLKQQSSTDPMTGLANRRELFATIEAHLSDEDFDVSDDLGFIYLDLDHFKAINDEHGHKAGDLVIEAFADHLQSLCDENMLCVRLGGEEFGVFIANANNKDAEALANEIVVSTRALKIAYRDQSIRFTVSAGMAVSSNLKTADDLLSQADNALMRAKRMGRDRVLKAA